MRKEEQTMNKLYITPAMEIIKIETKPLLSASDPADPGFGGGSDGSGGADSRFFDDWEDYEE